VCVCVRERELCSLSSSRPTHTRHRCTAPQTHARGA
jgi:hypothetical protein